MVYKHPNKKLLQKSTFSATKMDVNNKNHESPTDPWGNQSVSSTCSRIAPKVHVFSDKNTGRIYRATSNKL